MESEESVCGISVDEIKSFTTKTTRPPCSSCGSTHVISHGLSWQCRDCGRQMTKKLRGLRKISGRTHINCPKCGKHSPQSTGLRWKCHGCHRTWYKKGV